MTPKGESVMTVLDQALERTIVIRAQPDVVFRFFTDTGRWAQWWGAGSTIDPTPGGRMLIRYPDGTEAAGEVLEVAAPERIVFTYGYVKGKPIGVGESRVIIRVQPHSDGAQVDLTHEFADAAIRDVHVQGWRYQLSVFSNVVANEAYANAGDAIDAWFDVWAMADEGERLRTLERIAASGVTFRDRHSSVDGIAEIHPHIGAALKFMPGFRLRRSGAVRQCQGTVIADWTAVGPDGATRATGTNVFVFAPDARIQSVVGFWN